jgi:hypothetical protein
MAIPGKWDLEYSWGCAGGFSTAYLTFNEDGTWTGGEFVDGRWWTFSDKLIFTFTGSTVVYFGTIVGRLVTGFMSGSHDDENGCWFMTPIPSLALGAEGPKLDLAGRPQAA